MPKTLVVGASTNPDRYSYKAILRLLAHHHEVAAVSVKRGEVMGVSFQPPFATIPDVDTVTMYINPTLQKDYTQYLLDLAPRRVIFNPGTENAELEQLLEKQGIETLEACTLVLLSTGQY